MCENGPLLVSSCHDTVSEVQKDSSSSCLHHQDCCSQCNYKPIGPQHQHQAPNGIEDSTHALETPVQDQYERGARCAPLTIAVSVLLMQDMTDCRVVGSGQCQGWADVNGGVGARDCWSCVRVRVKVRAAHCIDAPARAARSRASRVQLAQRCGCCSDRRMRRCAAQQTHQNVAVVGDLAVHLQPTERRHNQCCSGWPNTHSLNMGQPLHPAPIARATPLAHSNVGCVALQADRYLSSGTLSERESDYEFVPRLRRVLASRRLLKAVHADLTLLDNLAKSASGSGSCKEAHAPPARCWTACRRAPSAGCSSRSPAAPQQQRQAARPQCPAAAVQDL